MVLKYTRKGKKMLIRFGVENFYSIRDRQEVSLVASSYKDHRESLFSVQPKLHLLPVIAIYGANASGKSNMLAGLSSLISAVQNSFLRRKPDSAIAFHPFKLDDESERKPTRLDCDFIIDQVRYHYGFAADDKRIIEEWLYAYPRGSRQVWFHRQANEPRAFYFGKELKGPNKDVERLTRDNALLLSAAAQANHPQLTKLYEYFSGIASLRMLGPSISEEAIAKYLRDEGQRERILGYLKKADFGVTDVRVTSREIPEETRSTIQSLIKVFEGYPEVSMDSISTTVSTKVQLGHGHGSEAKYFDFDDESTGTRQLLSLLGPMIVALASGKTVVLDEITTGLHTLVAQDLMELFTSHKSNPYGAQLIFTTHDTNLLNARVLRRDEVWLVEKGTDGASVVYPLSDIRTKPGDNIEKGYIQGRFGAVPFIGGDKKLTRRYIGAMVDGKKVPESA